MIRRPTSPFLLLLIGSATTALLTEWLRFQAGPALAALPLGTGAVLTLSAVGRAYHARRMFRAHQARLAEAAAHAEAARAAAIARGEAEHAAVSPAHAPLLESSDVAPKGREDSPERQLGVSRDRPGDGRSDADETEEVGEATVSSTARRNPLHEPDRTTP